MAAKAALISNTLTTQPFLAGAQPGDEDIKALIDLLGPEHTNILRWARHIASFPASERKNFPGTSGAATTSAEKAEKPATGDDDDDLDLFGEETEEDKKAKEELKKKQEQAKPKEKAT
eukprot:497652_1